MKKLCITGATGSIGESTLDVVRANPDDFKVVAVAAGSNITALADIAREFKPELVAIGDESLAAELEDKLADLPCRVLSGAQGVADSVAESGADLCVSAIVGAAGLLPTIAAIDAGMDVALANKETLVMAGELVMRRAADKGVRIIPVDSEHSAILQCWGGASDKDIRRLVITASGGPFRGRSREELQSVTSKEALKHPTWNMGRKITIDSATLANKALEVIEAHWLFGLAYDNIDVVVHPQSAVHGLVEFADGTMLAQIAPTDMKVPISASLYYPEIYKGDVQAADLLALGSLEFEAVDNDAFPMLDIGLNAGRKGGGLPAVYSAANEEAVDLFLNDRIGFNDIPAIVQEAMDEMEFIDSPELEAILDTDRQVRDFVKRRFA